MTATEVQREALQGKAAVVIDALRMTSVAITALANGASRIHTVRTIDAALDMRKKSKGGILLGGERGGQRIEGFELDNSPRGYTRAIVGGKEICMTTTNGTQAIDVAGEARRVLLCAFNNVTAVAAALQREASAVICCAGTDGRISMEDVLAAGALVERLGGTDNEMDDAAMAALRLYQQARGDLYGALAPCVHVRRMQSWGMEEDIRYCLREDRVGAVPERDAHGNFFVLHGAK